MPSSPAFLSAPALPALLALVRLPDGSALARAMPAWALSPAGKIDFRNTDDMLDLLEAVCDDVEKALPQLDLDSGSVYGVVQGERKIAVASVVSEPMEREEALKTLESLSAARHASAIIAIPSVEAGPYPWPKERAFRLAPGLELALAELDCVGQARHTLMGDIGPTDPPEVTHEQIRQVGLSFMKDQLNRQREIRLKELSERRELISALKGLDPGKAPLVIFLAETNYSLEGVFSAMPMYMKHALALPLADLAGKEWSLPERLRPEGLPEVASLALEKAQEAWAQFPNAGASCAQPDGARCLVIYQRLIVLIPLSQSHAAFFGRNDDLGVEGAAHVVRSSAWIMGLGERVAVSRDLRENEDFRSPKTLGLALEKDAGFWAETAAMDLALATPRAPAAPKRASVAI